MGDYDDIVKKIKGKLTPMNQKILAEAVQEFAEAKATGDTLSMNYAVRTIQDLVYEAGQTETKEFLELIGTVSGTILKALIKSLLA